MSKANRPTRDYPHLIRAWVHRHPKLRMHKDLGLRFLSELLRGGLSKV